MELEIYKTNYQEVANLFTLAEKALGKFLTANDCSTVYGFYDWLRLPFDVIGILLNYCIDQNKKSLRYIEKIAIDWSENNIDTKELAQEHIKNFKGNYREVLKSLGQGTREATKTEIKYIDKWQKDYQLPLEIILEACDKTIMRLGKPQFSYTDKILSSWHTSGAKTLEDIQRLEALFYEEKSKKTKSVSKAKSQQPKPKSKFCNYEETTVHDYDEMERIDLEILRQSMNGGK
jgi:DnaD/phage-associated family protein